MNVGTGIVGSGGEATPSRTGVILVTGVMAAGKSTVAQMLAEIPTTDGSCTKTATTRLRVEHDRTRLYVELSGEDGKGPWTVLVVDRVSRLYAVAQAETKTAATQAAAVALTELLEP